MAQVPVSEYTSEGQLYGHGHGYAHVHVHVHGHGQHGAPARSPGGLGYGHGPSLVLGGPPGPPPRTAGSPSHPSTPLFSANLFSDGAMLRAWSPSASLASLTSSSHVPVAPVLPKRSPTRGSGPALPGPAHGPLGPPAPAPGLASRRAVSPVRLSTAGMVLSGATSPTPETDPGAGAGPGSSVGPWGVEGLLNALASAGAGAGDRDRAPTRSSQFVTSRLPMTAPSPAPVGAAGLGLGSGGSVLSGGPGSGSGALGAPSGWSPSGPGGTGAGTPGAGPSGAPASTSTSTPSPGAGAGTGTGTGTGAAGGSGGPSTVTPPGLTPSASAGNLRHLMVQSRGGGVGEPRSSVASRTGRRVLGLTPGASSLCVAPSSGRALGGEGSPPSPLVPLSLAGITVGSGGGTDRKLSV
jgi:hypothetical protein